ncbi:MAG: adenine deaminase [Filimonas sp.]|nr:adenine deaminase [Filimonas sp.]
MANALVIEGNLVDYWKKSVYPAKVTVENGKISNIEQVTSILNNHYILPGFIDSHVHVESSMLTPVEFARLAVVHGTVSSISDPHEIANVCGMDGVRFMIENGKQVPFKFNFGAPSCVPATVFETAGATLDSNDVRTLLASDDVKYLSEMMNFPGVLMQDEEVMKKIQAAHEFGKVVDGHAPGLRGAEAKQYIDAGISTDHECFTEEEAREKIGYGMHILIREGSAAKNFEALINLLHEFPEQIMFCSDDKHPDSLAAGHIDQLCARAAAKKIDLFNIVRAACINPVLHYKLDVGMLRKGDAADFILVKDLVDFTVEATYINGNLVAENGKTNIASTHTTPINQFDCAPISTSDLAVPYSGEKEIPVIEALDGQLITNKLLFTPLVAHNHIVADTARDILKVVVVNRYYQAAPAIAWIKNFGIQTGAIASSVAHDSHNIIAVGADDESIAKAINLVIEQQGGVSCVKGNEAQVLALPIAGLMSAEDGYKVAEDYTAIDKMAKSLGSPLGAPFMTLSFMALLVIPHLKLSDKGLFDGDRFEFVR